jgi:hypothetical protein
VKITHEFVIRPFHSFLVIRDSENTVFASFEYQTNEELGELIDYVTKLRPDTGTSSSPR